MPLLLIWAVWLTLKMEYGARALSACGGTKGLRRTRARELERGLEELFGGMVEVPRIRHGSRQTLETLFNEEALLLAKYLRGERKTWIPRVVF